MAKLRINLQHITLLGFECAKFALTKIKIPWLFILHYPRLALTLFYEVRLRLGNVKEKSVFFFALHSPCTTLLREVRLRLGNKNKNPLAFYFVLPSPCTNFAS